MPAYATALRQSSSPTPPAPTGSSARLLTETTDEGQRAVIDDLVTAIANRIADAVAARIAHAPSDVLPEWLDSRGAAEYLGLHPDTIRKLAAKRAIPAEQDGPRCKSCSSSARTSTSGAGPADGLPISTQLTAA